MKIKLTFGTAKVIQGENIIGNTAIFAFVK